MSAASAVARRKEQALRMGKCPSLGCTETDVQRESGMCALHTAQCKKCGALGLDAGTIVPELFPMQVLDFHAWQRMGQIHHFTAPEFAAHPERRPIRVPYNDIDRAKAFVVFVSHKWLDELEAHEEKYWQREGHSQSLAHPDLVKAGHPKFQLILKAVRALQKGPVKGKRVYLWIDYSCIPRRPAVGSYSSYIERCDALLTPLVEDRSAAAEDAKWWERCRPSDNLFFAHEEYQSPAWKAYSSDAWCRLEMFLAAYAPLHPDCSGWWGLVDPENARRRGGGAARGQERAHLVYGDREAAQQAEQQQQQAAEQAAEQQQGLGTGSGTGTGTGNISMGVPAVRVMPIVLPAVTNSFLADLHPLLGTFRRPEDRELLQMLLTMLQRYRAETKTKQSRAQFKARVKKAGHFAAAVKGFGGGNAATATAVVLQRPESEWEGKEGKLRRLLEKRMLKESLGWATSNAIGHDPPLGPLERRFLGLQAQHDVDRVCDGHLTPLLTPVPTPELTPRSSAWEQQTKFASAMDRFGRKAISSPKASAADTDIASAGSKRLVFLE